MVRENQKLLHLNSNFSTVLHMEWFTQLINNNNGKVFIRMSDTLNQII